MNWIFLLTLFAPLCQATNLLIIDPPSSLSFDDSTFASASKKQVTVRLRSLPRGPALVSISYGPGVVVEPCTLFFDKDNWDKPQTVMVYALPLMVGSQTSASCQINFNIDVPPEPDEVDSISNPDGSNCKRGQYTLTVNRLVKPSSSCYTWYDPNIATLDGESYTTANTGNIYMLDSAETTIVINESAGSIKKVVVRHYDSFFTAHLGSGVFDSANQRLYNPTKTLITFTQNSISSPTSYTITLADGTSLALSAFGSTINFTLKVPGSYRSRTYGYCGNFDSISNYSPSLVPYVSTADNYFNCPAKNATHPFNGCRSDARQYQSVCTRQLAPPSFCDAAISGFGLVAVEEELNEGEGPVVVVPVDTGFSDSIPQSSYSISRVSRTLRSTASKISTQTSTSSSSNVPEPTTTSGIEPETGNSEVVELSAPEACYETIPKSVIVLDLPADQTDRYLYCMDATRSYTCTVIDFSVLCADIYLEPLSNAQAFTQGTMDLAQQDCAQEVGELLKSYSSIDRELGLQMALDHNVGLVPLDCSYDGSNPVVPLSEISLNELRAKVSSSAATSPTGISDLGDQDAGESSESGSGSVTTLVGVSSAAAIFVVGTVIGGIIVVLKRRKKDEEQFTSHVSGSNVALFQNPTYQNEERVKENQLYEGPELDKLKNKRKSSVMRQKV